MIVAIVLAAEMLLIIAKIIGLLPNAMPDRGVIARVVNAAHLRLEPYMRAHPLMRVVLTISLYSFVLLQAYKGYDDCIPLSGEGSTLKVLSIGEFLEFPEPIMWTGMVMVASVVLLVLTWPWIPTWPWTLTWHFPFRLILITIQLAVPTCFLYVLRCHLKSIAVSVAAMKIPAFVFILDPAVVFSLLVIAGIYRLYRYVIDGLD